MDHTGLIIALVVHQRVFPATGRTKEMMQPWPTNLHVISLVARVCPGAPATSQKNSGLVHRLVSYPHRGTKEMTSPVLIRRHVVSSVAGWFTGQPARAGRARSARGAGESAPGYGRATKEIRCRLLRQGLLISL